MTDGHYDYIIVGSGAGGAAAAWRLAQTGREVLVLEKGGRLPTDGSTLDPERVLRRAAFTSKELWRTPAGETTALKEYFNLGGKTKWTGGALIRLQQHEFEPDRSHSCVPWPISLDDLEPYYAEAERLLGVRSFEIEPDLRRILDQLRRHDPEWAQHPLPLGLAPQIYDHPEELRRVDGGFASPRGLKSDAEVCLLDRIEGTRHVSVVSGKEVVALEPVDGDPRRIGAVRCSDGSRYRGRTVLLAAGALHSPRLLQRYIRQIGVADASAPLGQIGGNFKRRLNSTVLAIANRGITDVLRKTAILFHPACPHSSVQSVGWIDGAVLGARLPAWVPDRVVNAIGARCYGFWLSTEDGSALANRVTDDQGAGHPTLDYDAARLPEASNEHRRLCRMMRNQLQRLGFVVIVKRSPLEQTAYACGTLAAGAEPQTSVIAVDGRVHSLENLYVVDGSAMPRAGRVNPGLTIYAWALRVADLLDRRGDDSRSGVLAGVHRPGGKPLHRPAAVRVPSEQACASH